MNCVFILSKVLEHFDLQDVHVLGPDVGMAAALYHAGTGADRVCSIIVGDGPGTPPSANGSVINKMIDSGFWRLILGNVGAGPFVEAANRLCYLNYVPNEDEISDYVKSYAGRVQTIIKWFVDYPKVTLFKSL